jgi:hypothetical protein
MPEPDRWHDRCLTVVSGKEQKANVPCNLNSDSLVFRQQFERWQNVFRV